MIAEIAAIVRTWRRIANEILRVQLSADFVNGALNTPSPVSGVVSTTGGGRADFQGMLGGGALRLFDAADGRRGLRVALVVRLPVRGRPGGAQAAERADRARRRRRAGLGHGRRAGAGRTGRGGTVAGFYLAAHLAVPTGMGGGDVKLALGLGAVTGAAGAQAWVLAALGAFALTAAVGVVLLAVGAPRTRRAARAVDVSGDAPGVGCDGARVAGVHSPRPAVERWAPCCAG